MRIFFIFRQIYETANEIQSLLQYFTMSEVGISVIYYKYRDFGKYGLANIRMNYI
jgi:hypothetical protein